MNTAMKWALPALLLLAACGAGKIILNVDIASFLDEADRTFNYDVPVPPTGGTAPGFILLGPEQVEVPEGVGSSLAVESGTLTLALEADNQTGAATFTVSLRLASSIVGLATGEVLSFDMALQPGQTTRSEQSIDLVDEVLLLFEGETLFVQVDVEQITIPSGQPLGTNLTGALVAETIDVRIVSRDDLL